MSLIMNERRSRPRAPVVKPVRAMGIRVSRKSFGSLKRIYARALNRAFITNQSECNQ